MLEIQNLYKQFKDVVAVNNISFEVDSGKIFGLLGPNGAGKTTTIRIILNIIKPTSGVVLYNGIKINRNFANTVGYLPEERGLYKKSKVLDILIYFAGLKSIEKSKAKKEAVKWLKRLEIEHYINKKVEELSKGNQQKIQFITSIIHNPQILILDEPFSGFDPINQQIIKELLSEFLNAGKLIVLSTHHMEIAENLCTDILLLNNGKKVLSGQLSEIKRQFGSNIYRIKFDGDSSFLKNMQWLSEVEIFDDSADVKLKEHVQIHEFLKEIVPRMKIKSFSPIEPSLNNIFLQTIKQNISA